MSTISRRTKVNKQITENRFKKSGNLMLNVTDNAFIATKEIKEAEEKEEEQIKEFYVYR